MRGVSREVLARDAAWTLADGSCRDLTVHWAQWEATYAAAPTQTTRLAALVEPTSLCAGSVSYTHLTLPTSDLV